MIIVDRALERRRDEGRPIRVGLVGAGFAGRGVVHQIVTATPGMEVVAVSNRTIGEAERAFRDAGVDAVARVDSVRDLEVAIEHGRPAVTDDPEVVCGAGPIDVIVEATGEVMFGVHVASAAIANGKHIVLVNAELDSTLGPILKVHADRAGVVLTDMDGDQPGVLLNLAREAQMLGFRPLLLGNIKSLLDHYRTPETQRGFAERVFQRPKMITSFADGTKIAAEMAVVANASGFRVGKRGMYGPAAGHVDEAARLFDLDELLRGGLVDYIIGAEPSFGVFVLGYNEKPLTQRYMSIYKMGPGPVYMFHRPYHLGPLEAPLSIARAVLFGDASVAPRGAPVCDVITLAKRDLRAGETLDGIGGFTVYGMLENSDVAVAEDLLPMGLSDGCVVVRDLTRDTPITYADIHVPPDRLADRLRAEQAATFPGHPGSAATAPVWAGRPFRGPR